MKIELGTKILVTTQDWFYAPDGSEYRGVYGTVKAIHSDTETLSIKTNARSTNWYLEIGNTIIAGCQVFYVVKSENPPPEKAQAWAEKDGGLVEYIRPSCVYNADTPT